MKHYQVVFVCSFLCVLLLTSGWLITLIKDKTKHKVWEKSWGLYILVLISGTLFIAGVWEGVIDTTGWWGPGIG